MSPIHHLTKIRQLSRKLNYCYEALTYYDNENIKQLNL